MLVINDRTFSNDRKNVQAFCDSVDAALKQLDEGLVEINASWTDQDDPKGTELKNSLDSLKSSAAKAHTELVASKDELFNSIQSILTKING